MRIIPADLRRQREAAGHSQASLARASKVSQSRISELETEDGQKLTVNPPLAKKLAKALRVPLSAISDAPQLANRGGAS